MIIDVHTHAFSKEIIENRDKFCNLDPSFSLIYTNKKAKLATSEDLIHSMDEAYVDKSIVCNYPWSKMEHCIRMNDYILESIVKYPKRLIGFCTVSIDDEEKAASEVERCLKAGMKGVGEMGFYYSDITLKIIKKLKPIMEIVKKYDAIFLLHTNESVGHSYPGKSPMKLKSLYNFIKTFQNVKIILAHWGGGFFLYHLMPEIEKLCENIYYDTAASPFLYKKKVYLIAKETAGISKILFGSDYPLLSPKKYIKEVKDLNLDESEFKKIFGENAKNLLKI